MKMIFSQYNETEAVLSIKSARNFYPHIGFSQGEIVGKVDLNLHDLW